MKLLFLFLFYCSITYSQYLGFSLDANGAILNDDTKMAYIPQGFSFLGGYEIVENLSLEARLGFSGFIYEYKGADVSMLVSYVIIDLIYVTANAAAHFNDGVEDEGTIDKTVGLFGAGAGVNLLKWLSLEAVYLKAFSREEWKQNYDFYKTGFWWEYIEGAIRVSAKFHWDVH